MNLHCDLWLRESPHRRLASHNQNWILLWTCRVESHNQHSCKLPLHRTCHTLLFQGTCITPNHFLTIETQISILNKTSYHLQTNPIAMDFVTKKMQNHQKFKPDSKLLIPVNSKHHSLPSVFLWISLSIQRAKNYIWEISHSTCWEGDSQYRTITCRQHTACLYCKYTN